MSRLVKVAIINASTVLSDAQVSPLVAAYQLQVSQDFAPVWGIDAKLTFIPRGQKPPAGYWWLVFTDTADVAGALGYHDLTTDSLPIGKVFAKTTLDNGDIVSVTGSHELLEMLADPDICRTILVNTAARRGRLYAMEVCDPCEVDAQGYDVMVPGGPTRVSDFVWPAWFGGFRAMGQVKFDQQGLIQHPFELLPGGYISYLDFRTGTGWQQEMADAAQMKTYRTRPPVGSRRERRRTDRDTWRPSTIR